MKHVRTIGIFLFILTILSLPALSIVHAQTTPTGIVPCDGVNVPCDFAAFNQLIQNVLDFMFKAAVLVTVGLLVYAGFLYVTAGTQSGLARAKGIFKSVAIGFILMLSAYLIIKLIVDVLVDPSFWTTTIQNPLS